MTKDQTLLPEPFLSKEWQFVLGCLAPHAYQQENNSHTMDWAKVYTICKEHGLISLVWKAITTADDNCVMPEQYQNRFREFSHNLLISNLFTSHELHRILDAFQAVVPCIPVKGPVLAAQIYKCVGKRSYSDLDLLIPYAAFPPANRILKELGYRPLIVGEASPAYRKAEYDLKYIGRTGTVIELHWELTGFTLCKEIGFNEARQFSSDLPFLGKTVSALENELLILYLCIHGNKHHWERLEWLYSVAILIDKKMTTPYWESLVALAVQYRCERIIRISLLLCIRLFGSRVPETVIRWCKNDLASEKLTKSILNFIAHDKPNHPYRRYGERFSPFQIFVRQRWEDKLRYAGQMLFRPTREEFYREPQSKNYMKLRLIRFRRLACLLINKNNIQL